MKRALLTVIFLGTMTLLAHAQSERPEVINIPTLQEEMRQEMESLNKQLDQHHSVLKDLEAEIESNESEIKNNAAEFGDNESEIKGNTTKIRDNESEIKGNITKIRDNESEIKDNIADIIATSKEVKKNYLYWIIATLIIFIMGVLMCLFLGKRIKSSQTNVETQIKDVQALLQTFEEASLKLDAKLVEVLEKQLKVDGKSAKIQGSASDEAGHSLALKVADEVVRMQKNISRMDADTKGLKPLEKGIDRIQDNFAANGYEMVNLLNQEYDDGMNIDVINFIEDETMEPDKKTITKIIKPQVNFNGVLIQRAQVEVSQN